MRPRFFVPLALAVLLGVGAFIFRDALMWRVKAWRYRETISQAEEAQESGDKAEIARLAGAAMRLSSGSVSEARELFALASGVLSPDAMLLAEALFEHDESELEDRIQVLEFISAQNQVFLLEGLLGRFDEFERQEPRVIAIRVGQLLRKGDRLGALLLMDSLAADDYDLQSLKILKGQLLAGERGNPLAWRECRKLLQGCLLYTSPSPRDQRGSRMPSSA